MAKSEIPSQDILVSISLTIKWVLLFLIMLVRTVIFINVGKYTDLCLCECKLSAKLRMCILPVYANDLNRIMRSTLAMYIFQLSHLFQRVCTRQECYTTPVPAVRLKCPHEKRNNYSLFVNHSADIWIKLWRWMYRGKCRGGYIEGSVEVDVSREV